MGFLGPSIETTEDLDLIIPEKTFFVIALVVAGASFLRSHIRFIRQLAGIAPWLVLALHVLGAFAFTYVNITMAHQLEDEAVGDSLIQMIRSTLVLSVCFLLLGVLLLLVPKEAQGSSDISSSGRRFFQCLKCFAGFVLTAVFLVSVYNLTLGLVEVFRTGDLETIGIAGCYTLVSFYFLQLFTWNLFECCSDETSKDEYPEFNLLERTVGDMHSNVYYLLFYTAMFTIAVGGCIALLVTFFVKDMKNQDDAGDAASGDSLIVAVIFFAFSLLFLALVLFLLLKKCSGVKHLATHNDAEKNVLEWEPINETNVDELEANAAANPPAAKRGAIPPPPPMPGTLAAVDKQPSYVDKAPPPAPKTPVENGNAPKVFPVPAPVTVEQQRAASEAAFVDNEPPPPPPPPPMPVSVPEPAEPEAPKVAMIPPTSDGKEARELVPLGAPIMSRTKSDPRKHKRQASADRRPGDGHPSMSTLALAVSKFLAGRDEYWDSDEEFADDRDWDFTDENFSRLQSGDSNGGAKPSLANAVLALRGGGSRQASGISEIAEDQGPVTQVVAMVVGGNIVEKELAAANLADRADGWDEDITEQFASQFGLNQDDIMFDISPGRNGGYVVTISFVGTTAISQVDYQSFLDKTVFQQWHSEKLPLSGFTRLD